MSEKGGAGDEDPTLIPVDSDLPAADQGARSDRLVMAPNPLGLIVLVIAAGGAVGGTARYLLELAIPSVSGQIPVATLLVNVTGCALLGLLMVFVTETWVRQVYIRPFLGVGVLGGYTTFSSFAVEVDQLVADGAYWPAVGYVAASAIGGFVAVYLGLVVGRGIAGVSPRHRLYLSEAARQVD